jgi:predicted metal-binding membrane protein
MSGTSALERVLRHDRLIFAGGITAVTALAWAYLLAGAGIDMSMADMPMDPMPWSPSYAALVFAMWLAMMIAMMVSSAAPMVLFFAALKRKQSAAASPLPDAWIFLYGYFLIWTGFSLAATLAQWQLERIGLLSMAMASTSATLGGGVLLLAGLYQFTPIKRACLRYCQSPVLFLSQHWRPGTAGALHMGLRHGLYCLGCCWFLMALLFVGGVMNLLWIVGITLYVCCEKLLPLSHHLSRAAGAGLITAGLIVLGHAI